MTEPLPDQPAPTPTEVEKRPDPPKYAVKVGVPVHTLDEAWRLAQALSLADLVPRGLRGKPSDILLVILYGAELGLTPAQSLQGIDPVQGTPRIRGRLWAAKLRERGHRSRIVERVPLVSCTVEIERGDTGEKHVETYTIEQAVTARLCRIVEGQIQARSKHGEAMPWETQTDRMLYWRALANGASILCPEVVFGFDVSDGSEHADDESEAPAHAEATREDEPPMTPEEVQRARDEAIRAEAEALARDFAAEAAPAEDRDSIVDAEIVEDEPDLPDPGPDYVDPWAQAEQEGAEEGS